MDRKDLEGKLRAIQDLKAERYIGTAEAWDYLKRLELVYDFPLQLSEEINAQIKSQKPLVYKATPQRILGLIDVVNQKIDEIVNEEFEYLEESEIEKAEEDIEYTPEKDQIFNIWIETYCGVYKPEFLKNMALESLAPLFMSVQDDHANDESFGNFASEKLTENFPMTNRSRLDYSIKIGNVDWNHALSTENLRELEKKFSKTILEYTLLFNLVERYEHIKNDLVDNRLEYRRQILLDYLSSADTNSYEELLESIRRRLESANRRIKRPENQDKRPWPEAWIKSQKRRKALLEYVAMAAAPERNFITKYLAS